MGWRLMCTRSGMLIKRFFFQNQKSDWVEKNKGFLIIFFSYNEHKKFDGKIENGESVT